MDLLLIAALLPAIVLVIYVYRKDTVEKESPALLLRLFLFGVISGPIAALLEEAAFTFFESVIPVGPFLLVMEYFIGVALVEEGCKYFFTNRTWNNKEFNYVFDGIVYAVVVALGFATLENILYVFNGGFEVAITRAIFAVPGHAADGAIMGCFYGIAKKYAVFGDAGKSSFYRVLALLVPVVEHGFYDCALSTGSEMWAMVAMLVELAFIFFAMKLVNNMSKRDEPLYQ